MEISTGNEDGSVQGSRIRRSKATAPELIGAMEQCMVAISEAADVARLNGKFSPETANEELGASVRRFASILHEAGVSRADAEGLFRHFVVSFGTAPFFDGATFVAFVLQQAGEPYSAEDQPQD